jgi:hypothetical protein
MRPFLLAAVALLAATAGCASKSQETRPHTHVRAGDQNLWSYQRVVQLSEAGGGVTRPDGHLSRELRAGESVTLEDGTVVRSDGSTLLVGDRPVNSRNSVVDPDGTLRPDAFIRGFE